MNDDLKVIILKGSPIIILITPGSLTGKASWQKPIKEIIKLKRLLRRETYPEDKEKCCFLGKKVLIRPQKYHKNALFVPFSKKIYINIRP